MPDWMPQFVGPVVSGAVAGVTLMVGLKVEVRNLREQLGSLASSLHRAHIRIDDHIERHHVRRGQ